MSSVVANSPVSASRSFVRPISTPYKWAIGLSLFLLAATILLYLPVLHHPFANIDDQGYVYENLHVQEGLTPATIKWALRTFDDSNWHPLTWLSHALDCQLFGLDPAGHHEMNVVLHAIDVVLLFWVLLRATGFLWRSFMVAALFAFHPMNVESVAWVAERKTMLSTLFFLLAIGAYRWYARQPSVIRYCVVAGLFVLGLMAKPQIITLPCVLLLWDYWPLRRMFAGTDAATDGPDIPPAIPPKSLWFLVKEKIPLFVICGASALVTMKAQHVGHPKHWPFSVWIRIGNAFVSYVRYMGKAIWPSKLAIMYLHPGNSLKLWQAAASGLLLLIITALVLIGHRYRYLPVGWFWFLGTMVPTIGLIQVGRQAMADRYAYQSYLGLFILVCWGVGDWVRKKHLPAALLPAVSVAVLLAFSAVTYRQIGFWNDNLTLWYHTLDVTKDNWMAHDMAGGILLNTGHREEAIAHYRLAVATNPTDSGSNLAIALYEQQKGNLPEAIARYKKSLIELDDPFEQAKVYQNMAVAYRDSGNSDQSLACLRRAAKLRAQR